MALGLATLAEVAAVHLLLSRWSVTAAWVATVAGLASLTWIMRDYRSVRGTPHRVLADQVEIRRGLLWRADIPMEKIRAVRVPTSSERSDASGAVDLLLWLPAAPWVLLEMDAPITVRGLAGIKRQVRRLGVSVDDPPGFAAAVTEALKQIEAAPPT